MKKLAVICSLLLLGANAHAACTTHTMIVNGKIITCTTCCHGQEPYRTCTTTCN
jgi:hypothetical protein